MTSKSRCFFSVFLLFVILYEPYVHVFMCKHFPVKLLKQTCHEKREIKHQDVDS